MYNSLGRVTLNWEADVAARGTAMCADGGVGAIFRGERGMGMGSVGVFVSSKLGLAV